MQQIKLKQIIHISTSEVYGSPKKVQSRGLGLNAQSPYAASKAADQLALSFHHLIYQ